MTNTKFRKRALLSSIAMLLVALVALGSATFAWFVANPTATANGLVISTRAAAGIAVASQTILGNKGDGETYNAAYKGTTILNATGSTIAGSSADQTAKILQPSSPNTTLAANSNNLSFGYIEAQGSGAKTGKTAGKFTAITSGASDYYYNEKVYLRTTTTDADASATVNSVSVTIAQPSGDATVKNGVRVALTSSKNELIGIWKPSAGTDTKTWNGNTTDTYGAAGADVLSSSAYSYTASGTYKALPTAITVGPTMNSENGTTSDYINVYVYLDGEDAAVYSDNVPNLTQMVSSITVSVSTNTVS